MNKNKEECNHKNKICTQSTISNLLILAIASHFNGKVVPPKKNIKRIASIKNVKLSKIQNYFHFGSPISSQRHILQFVVGFCENKSSQHMFSNKPISPFNKSKTRQQTTLKGRKELFFVFHSCQHKLVVPKSIQFTLQKIKICNQFYFFFSNRLFLASK